MTIVQQVLKEKGFYVWTVSPDTSLMDALKLMAEKNIGAVLVVDGTNVAGVFSERDFARYTARDGLCGLDTPVQELMTEVVYIVGPDNTVEDCMALMVEKRIRHLPVLEEGKIIGLISIGDVVHEVISQKEITIQSMENYILGRGYMQQY
jgi:CBS domain-containing protein